MHQAEPLGQDSAWPTLNKMNGIQINNTRMNGFQTIIVISALMGSRLEISTWTVSKLEVSELWRGFQSKRINPPDTMIMIGVLKSYIERFWYVMHILLPPNPWSVHTFYPPYQNNTRKVFFFLPCRPIFFWVAFSWWNVWHTCRSITDPAGSKRRLLLPLRYMLQIWII